VDGEADGGADGDGDGNAFQVAGPRRRDDLHLAHFFRRLGPADDNDERGVPVSLLQPRNFNYASSICVNLIVETGHFAS
jgi:hypothetical protein